MAKTKCDNCPILYNDQVYDPSCNLGYEVYWNQSLNKGDEYRSDECGLEFVRFAGGEFRPTKVQANGDFCECHQPKLLWKESSGWYCSVCYKPPRR